MLLHMTADILLGSFLHKSQFKDFYEELRDGFLKLDCILNPETLHLNVESKNVGNSFTLSLKVFTEAKIKHGAGALSLFLQGYSLSENVPIIYGIKSFCCQDITNYNRQISLLYMDLTADEFRKISSTLGVDFKVSSRDRYYWNVFYSDNYSFNTSTKSITKVWNDNLSLRPKSITFKGVSGGIELPSDPYPVDTLKILSKNRERRENVCILRTNTQLLNDFGKTIAIGHRLVDTANNFQEIEFRYSMDLPQDASVYSALLAKGNYFVCRILK